MRKYVKQHWNEMRGDQHDCWGTSWWYFEVIDGGQVTRQVEQYQSGAWLHYDSMRNVDEYGGLASEPLNLSESAYLEILDQEFEQVWESALKAAY
jgi:hypothetical protein